jgi:hypothetical protein
MGSSSTPETPAGSPDELSALVIGDNDLRITSLTPFPAFPGNTAAVSTTANNLTEQVKKNGAAVPFIPASGRKQRDGPARSQRSSRVFLPARYHRRPRSKFHLDAAAGNGSPSADYADGDSRGRSRHYF